MKQYKITVVIDGKRHTFHSISASWYDAWEATISQFGIPAVIVVKPV